MRAAILDTCVLIPSLQRDVLLSMAVEGMYEARWSPSILEELAEHHTRLLRRRERMDEHSAHERMTHLLHEMGRAFPDAVVSAYDQLVGTFDLPDVDDEHVLAAAVVGGADAIVTHNLRDFPLSRMPRSVRVIDPTHFADELIQADPDAAWRTLEAMSRRRHHEPRTPENLLEILTARTLLARETADWLRRNRP